MRDYYSRKVEAHGATPAGVDWSSEATQALRFERLLSACDLAAAFSLNDLGCGWGALVAHLSARGAGVDYLGIDVSPAMIAQARALWRGVPGVRFRQARRSPRIADYSVASGIFNVKLRASRAAWEALIETTLREMHATSSRAFAVNFLAPQPAHLGQPRELYRCEPGRWLDFCRSEFGADVALDGGYGLAEYMLVVRRRR